MAHTATIEPTLDHEIAKAIAHGLRDTLEEEFTEHEVLVDSYSSIATGAIVSEVFVYPKPRQGSCHEPYASIRFGARIYARITRAGDWDLALDLEYQNPDTVDRLLSFLRGNLWVNCTAQERNRKAISQWAIS